MKVPNRHSRYYSS